MIGYVIETVARDENGKWECNTHPILFHSVKDAMQKAMALNDIGYFCRIVRLYEQEAKE